MEVVAESNLPSMLPCFSGPWFNLFIASGSIDILQHSTFGLKVCHSVLRQDSLLSLYSHLFLVVVSGTQNFFIALGLNFADMSASSAADCLRS